MKEFEYRPIVSREFLGRKFELDWLRERLILRPRMLHPIVVSGNTGVGKTSLIHQFLASQRLSSTLYWLNLEPSGYSKEKPLDVLNRFTDLIYTDIPRNDFIVVIDGADSLTDDQLKNTAKRIFNIKATRGLIFICRKDHDFKDAEHLNLHNLLDSESINLVKTLMGDGLDFSKINQAFDIAKGNPLAISLLVEMLKRGGSQNFDDILSGRLYNISNGIALPETEIITSITPRIVSATDQLIAKLQRQPQSIFELTPRRFEELLAELLTDMGWEVELTQATRDGGKDILAYLDTDLGKMLCLVEAKRFRQDRTVGVDLVRNLYGTLCDHQANSAMLITTSSFSADARAFQKRHEYQLRLREFGDIIQWIQNYKNRTGFI